MAVREATLNDCEIIAEFGNELIAKSKYGPILFKDFRLVSAEIPYCVSLEDTRIVEEGGEAIGFASYAKMQWLISVVGKIVYIYIKPEYRKQGYMKQVLEDFETWGKDCNFLTLGITTGAIPSDYQEFERIYMKEVK